MVRAFKAIRPRPDLCEKIAALPYDVMTADEAREMVKDNPYSFLHVDKAEIDLDPGIDPYSPEVYKKAHDTMYGMLEHGELIQDDEPKFYIYRLTMDGRSQNGLVACASIDDYISGKIKKHELTREDKEQDRIRHVETCDANTGPIFLTYNAQAELDSLIADYAKANTPVYDFVSDDDIGHTVWVINDAAVAEKIETLFKNVPALYIADGHHRNASAVKVGLKRRQQNPSYTGEEEFNFYLAVIFPHDQLYIMDYNRVVKSLNGRTTEKFFAEIGEKFTVEEAGAAEYKPKALHEFGMYIEGKWYKLTAKPGTFDSADPVAALDVSILQANLLNPVLGIDDPRTNKNIDFVGGLRGLGELSKRVDSGEMKVAFAMYPTSMVELMSIADAGQIMPPKSTWFEPKLRSGIFVHKLS